MSNHASDRIRRLNSDIIDAWETRALKEVSGAFHKTSLSLRNYLPEFLENVGESLSNTIDRTEVKVKLDRDVNERTNKIHGAERAASVDYTIDQLIFEYHILRQVIFDIMEKEGPLSTVDREIIICSVEQAVNDAATQFCKNVSDINLKLARHEDQIASVRARDEFLTVVSHELKTPLTPLLLQAQMILKQKNNKDDEHIKKVYGFIRQVNTQVKQISYLIDDLMDVGRIRTGSYKPAMRRINICDIINEVIDTLNPVFEAFRIGPPEFVCLESSIVCVDKDALIKVFRSLFTNSIKYGQGKPVSVEVQIKDTEVEIVITDHGVGIRPEYIDHIFAKFERAISYNEVSGIGLGLYIAKEIITAHGGRIWVESKIGEGSAFHFSLPRWIDKLENKDKIKEFNSVTLQRDVEKFPNQYNDLPPQ